MNRHRVINAYFLFYIVSLSILLIIHYWLVQAEVNHYERQQSLNLFNEMVEESQLSGYQFAKNEPAEPTQDIIDNIIRHHPALKQYDYQIIVRDPDGMGHIRFHTVDDKKENISSFKLDRSVGYGRNDYFNVNNNIDKLDGWIRLPDNSEITITLIHKKHPLDTTSPRFWFPLMVVLLMSIIAFSMILSRLHLWQRLISYANNMSKPNTTLHKYNTYEAIDYQRKSVGQEFSRAGHALSRANYQLHHDRRKIEILQKRIERLLTRAPLPIAYVNSDGVLSHINERFNYIFRMSLQHSDKTLIQDIVTGVTEHDDSILHNLAEQNITRSIQVNDQQGQIYQLNIMPWFAQHGTIQGHTLILNNITQFSSQLNETLLQVNQQNARLAEFDKLWSVIGHELRTPLSGIIGMIDLLKDTNLNPEQREIFETLEQTSQTMLFMLNDMLDLAKLDAGKLQLSVEKTDLLQLARQVCDLMVGNARKQNIELLFCYDPNAVRYINTDEARLRQILLNLIGNAIKFTQSGYVALKISMTETIEEDDSKLFMCLDIIDTGIGISKEEQSKLFSFFNQANSNISKNFGGTGLGLAISKNFTEMMGGEIILTSEPNVGSKFSVRLPIDKRYEQPVYQFKGDFSHICLIGITNLQVKADHVVQLCHYLNIPFISGIGLTSDSIDKINEQLNTDEMKGLTKILIISHSLLITDEQDNQLTNQLIENQPVEKATTDNQQSTVLPAVLSQLTDYDSIQKLLVSMTPERSIPNQLLEAFDGYISSPLDISHLISELLRLSQKNDDSNSMGVSKLQYSFNNFLAELESSKEAGNDKLDKGKHSKNNNSSNKPDASDLTNRPTILVAEDNKVNQKVASKLLNKLGYNVLIANDGQEALDMLAEQRDKISMVLMDCRMPVMDGLTATRQIRSREDSIPIIALTANDTDEDKQICLKAGMDNFMSKPLKRDSLEAMINKYGI